MFASFWGSPSPYGDSCFSDDGSSAAAPDPGSVSPSPYGDSCFSDLFKPPFPALSCVGLRPLTGIRASLTKRSSS